MKNYSYSTIQINLPIFIASLVKYWIAGYIDPLILSPDEENGPDLHITIQYGLTTNNGDLVKSIIQDTGSFNIQFGNISLFEQELYDVVKINIKSEGIHKLNKVVTSKLEYITNFPDYVPHCTLAYVLKGHGQQYKNNPFFNGISFLAKEAQFRSADQQVITKILL
jgi:hypothetical protein